MNIPLPNINASNEREQLAQIKSYLFQFVSELQHAMNTVEKQIGMIPKTTEQKNTTSAESEETKAQDDFNEIKALIIKSADVVNSYYQQIVKKINGEYFADSDFGTFVSKTTSSILASDSLLQATVKKVETITTDISDIRESQTVISQTANSVKIDVDSIIKDGASKVKTSTGYEFGDDGLSVAKSGKKTKSLITEDGLRVQRTDVSDDASDDEKNTLVAGSDGVDAKNLRASTYIDVADLSRTDRYGENRIGVFWIG